VTSGGPRRCRKCYDVETNVRHSRRTGRGIRTLTNLFEPNRTDVYYNLTVKRPTSSIQHRTRHTASTSTRWNFAFGLRCHSNETRAPTANPPNSAQLGAPPTIPPSYTRVRAVGLVLACGRGQTHRRARPIYISRHLRLARNVISANSTKQHVTVQQSISVSPRGSSVLVRRPVFTALFRRREDFYCAESKILDSLSNIFGWTLNDFVSRLR